MIPKDATHLFEEHKTKSEQWWTSLFSLLLINLSKENGASLPLHGFSADVNGWRIERSGTLDCSAARTANIHVEASLYELFPPLGLPFAADPDVVILDPGKRFVRIIENKTQGAGVGRL